MTPKATKIERAGGRKTAGPAVLTRAIFSMHDKPERWPALDDIHHLLPRRYILLAFSEIWTNSESNDLHIPLIDSLIERYAIRADSMMPLLHAEDRRLFDSLPARFRVYRGTTLEAPYSDYSWTIDRSKALWFAQRCYEATPALATGWVNKEDILFTCAGRGESEIAVQTKFVAGRRVRAVGPWQANACYKFFAACHRVDPFVTELLLFRVRSARQIGLEPRDVLAKLYGQATEAETLGFRTWPAKRRALLDGIDWQSVLEGEVPATPEE